MSRTILLTCASLAALVCFAVSSEDQEASAGLFNRCGGRDRAACCEPVADPCECGGREGLFARLKARRAAKKAACCEPAPTCCPAPCEPVCCEPVCEPTCCEPCATDCGCAAPASDCGCGGTVIMESTPSAVPAEAAPEAPAADPAA